MWDVRQRLTGTRTLDDTLRSLATAARKGNQSSIGFRNGEKRTTYLYLMSLQELVRLAPPTYSPTHSDEIRTRSASLEQKRAEVDPGMGAYPCFGLSLALVERPNRTHSAVGRQIVEELGEGDEVKGSRTRRDGAACSLFASRPQSTASCASTLDSVWLPTSPPASVLIRWKQRKLPFLDRPRRASAPATPTWCSSHPRASTKGSSAYGTQAYQQVQRHQVQDSPRQPPLLLASPHLYRSHTKRILSAHSVKNHPRHF